MDIVKHEGINVCNSVLISGLTQTEVDEELEKHLERYGSINRVLVIDDPRSEYHMCSILEFAHNSAMHTLRPILPIEYQSSIEANITFQVRSLDSVYTSTASSSATKGYLEELQAIANKSGRSFESVLQEELRKISAGKGVSLPADAAPVEAPQISSYDATGNEVKDVNAPLQVIQPSLLLGSVSPEIVRNLPAVFPPSPLPRHGQHRLRGDAQAASTPALQRLETATRSPQAASLPTSVNGQSQLVMLTAAPSPSMAANLNANHQELSNKASGGDDTAATTCPVLTMNDVNPPVVQRVVVEHVVRANEAMSPMHSSFRLRPFSGKIPRPNNELDYDTWRANVDLFLTDPSMSDLHRTRKILDSLLPPATDLIKHVSPQTLPSVYLQLLDSVYGSVEDGDELLAKFMGTLQNNDEKPSDYLNRLQVALSAVVRRGRVAEREQSRYLLKQFCRGCWNDGLIADLQLERKSSAPPSFAELVLLIRTEEDKQASKHNRMKRHLGLHKQNPTALKLRAASQQLAACSCAAPEKEVTETESLKKQLNEVQTQVAAIQTAALRKAKANCPDVTEINTLKRHIADIQVQVADMRKAAQGEKKDHLEATEIETLKHQLALLQAQMTRPQAQSHQIQPPAFSKDFSMTARYKSPHKRVSGESSSGPPVNSRPRPWYCFCCGGDAHLAVNCGSEPNPLLVEEKRRLLKEKQWQWDQQNSNTGTQQLNC
ncbi:uncharacterized protein LOC114447698 [Parambassis ranga]|uniref:Uncharacterized protein LOC114447698 n=1 Tax=Parambassis ranga TaxID=210632 RepID=A0A6P7JWM1_9TELE|nr:uncharacterized protein LOC114447698 [Parambassis ranga]